VKAGPNQGLFDPENWILVLLMGSNTEGVTWGRKVDRSYPYSTLLNRDKG
jgi:hypothetical protein